MLLQQILLLIAVCCDHCQIAHSKQMPKATKISSEMPARMKPKWHTDQYSGKKRNVERLDFLNKAAKKALKSDLEEMIATKLGQQVTRDKMGATEISRKREQDSRTNTSLLTKTSYRSLRSTHEKPTREISKRQHEHQQYRTEDNFTTQSDANSTEKPEIILPMHNIYAEVGVAFQKYLQPEIFVDHVDGNARFLNVELLTADGKELFETSWIKFDGSKLKLYGFPLQGNEDSHTFHLKATNSRKAYAIQTFSVIVHNLPKIFNHFIVICTPITLAEYAGDVERRLRLSKALGDYFFPGIRLDDVWIIHFEDGCITVTFRQLPMRQKCDFNAVQRIKEKMIKDGEINNDFRRAMQGVTSIKTANLTLLKECQSRNQTNKDDGLGWLRDVAPIFILLAVVAVPTLISCIVCKEVRSRQALMRQIQDRRMKEDKEQMLIQAAEYKHECGLDSDSEDDEHGAPAQKKTHNEEDNKFFGFSKIADIIIPDVLIDTVKHGTEFLNTLLPQDSSESITGTALETAHRKVSVMASLNPKNRLLDLSQEEKLRQEKAKKKGSKVDTKVKKVVRFVKNPLEIKLANIEEHSPHVDNKRTKAQEPSTVIAKNQGFAISSILPDIRSVLKKVKSDDTETISSSLRNKLAFLLSSSSSFSSATTTQTSLSTTSQAISSCALDDIQEQSDKDIRAFEEEGLFLEKDNDLHHIRPLYPQQGQSSSNIPPDFGMTLQAGIAPILRQNMTNLRPEQRAEKEAGMQKECKRSRTERTILGKIIDNGKRFLQTLSEDKTQDDFTTVCLEKMERKMSHNLQLNHNLQLSLADQQMSGVSFEEYKQYSENGILLKLAESNDAGRSQEQLCCLNYGITANLKRDYFHTTPMVAASKINDERFPARSELRERLASRHVFDENYDFCFVNMPGQQLTDEICTNRFTYDYARLYPRQLDVLAYDSDTHTSKKFDDIVASGFESCYDEKIYNEEHVGVSDKTQTLIPRTGLLHYDPISEQWYQSLTPTKEITEDVDMIYSRLVNDDLLGQWREPQESASIQQSNLTWHNLTPDDTQYNHSIVHENLGRQRRTSGLGLRTGPRFGGDISLLNCQEESLQEDKGIILKQREMPDLLNSESQNDYIGFPHHYNADYRDETLMDRKPLFGRAAECYQFDNNPEEYRAKQDVYRHQRNQGIQELQASMDSCHVRADDDLQFRHRQVDWHYYRDISDHGERSFGEDGCEDVWLDINGHQRTEAIDEGADHVVRIQTSYQVQVPQLGAYEEYGHCQSDLEEYRRDRTESQVSLSASTGRAASQDSSTASDADSTERCSLSSNSRRERRRSVLERQYRVEIPEQTAPKSKQMSPTIQMNPMFVIDEGQHPVMSGDRGNPDGDIDVLAASKRKISSSRQLTVDDVRKPPYGDSFSHNETEAEEILQKDAAIMDQQMKNYLKLGYQPTNFDSDVSHQMIANRRLEQICGKRDELPKRPGMRRFSTPSMESWTSTPEKYYYDATGDNSISEEDIAREAIRNEQQKQSFTGRGRAREYTTRLLKGVSPRIRRHSTSVMGQQPNFTPTSNSGTFLGKIGEGKLVQTIQTKLGRKESRSEEPKSPKVRDREKIFDDEKSKGSPLNAIRNKLYLLSGGK